jgi:hypothetical protein
MRRNIAQGGNAQRSTRNGCHPEAAVSSRLKDHLGSDVKEAALVAVRKHFLRDPSVAERLLPQDDRRRRAALNAQGSTCSGCHPEAAVSSRLKDHLGSDVKEAALVAVRKHFLRDPSVAVRLLPQDDRRRLAPPALNA